MKHARSTYAACTVLSIIGAIFFLSIEDYKTDTLIIALILVLLAIGFVMLFSIESEKIYSHKK